MFDGLIENQMASRCEGGKNWGHFYRQSTQSSSAFVSRQSPPYWNVSHPLWFTQKINSSSWRVRSFQVPMSKLLIAQWSHPSCLGLDLESRLLGPDYIWHALQSFELEVLLVMACYPREPFLGGMFNTSRNEQYKVVIKAPWLLRTSNTKMSSQNIPWSPCQEMTNSSHTQDN